MFRRLFVGWVVLAIAIGLVAGLLPGLHINGGALTLLWVAALVINAAMFELIDWMSDSLTIDTFWWSLLAATLVTGFAAVLTFVLHRLRSGDEGRQQRREPRVA